MNENMQQSQGTTGNEVPNGYSGQRFVVKPATSFKDQPDAHMLPVYPLRSKNRGVYLIINNVNLNQPGAQEDHEDLVALFSQLGLVGEDYQNLTLEDMKSTVSKFKEQIIQKKPDCCIVVIMSLDMDLDLTWIQEHFNNNSCNQLRGIPKIFLFDVPRGDIFQMAIVPKRYQYVVADPEMAMIHFQMKEDDEPGFPIISDILICWSTDIGYRNMRTPDGRSWFIESICKIWSEYACDHHVEDLMKLVQDDLKNRIQNGRTQTTVIGNLDFRICFLNPGMYLSDK